MVTDIANLFIDFEKGDLYKKSFFLQLRLPFAVPLISEQEWW